MPKYMVHVQFNTAILVEAEDRYEAGDIALGERLDEALANGDGNYDVTFVEQVSESGV